MAAESTGEQLIELGRVRTASPEETFELAARLGEDIERAAAIALLGDLGAGKTQFAKGLAKGLGVVDHRSVNSPTFVIMQAYVGRLRIHHYDAYRLGGVDELLGLGFDEDLDRPDLVVVVEWADRVAGAMPSRALEVELRHDGSEERREIVFRGEAAWKPVIAGLPGSGR